MHKTEKEATKNERYSMHQGSGEVMHKPTCMGATPLSKYLKAHRAKEKNSTKQKNYQEKNSSEW